MLRFVIYICMILPMMASASVFDVLQDDDRYKNITNNEFDVDEGDDLEETSARAISENPNMNKFDHMNENGSYHNIAKIAVLNKITARSKQLSINVGQKAYFGNIEITPKKCWSNGDLYSPSHKILLSVVENKIDEDPKNIFNGWIISSNIPVSVLQNPSYEIIALECYDRTHKK